MPDGKFIMPPGLEPLPDPGVSDQKTIKLEKQPGWKSKLATTSRVLGSMGGSMVSTVPSPLTTGGGALIGGAGEAIAELLEEGKISPARVGVEAGLAALPGGALLSKGKWLASAAKGVGITQLGNSMRRLAQGESPLPQTEDLGPNLLGGVVGGVVGRMTKAPSVKAPAADAPPPPAKPRTIPEIKRDILATEKPFTQAEHTAVEAELKRNPHLFSKDKEFVSGLRVKQQEWNQSLQRNAKVTKEAQKQAQRELAAAQKAQRQQGAEMAADINTEAKWQRSREAMHDAALEENAKRSVAPIKKIVEIEKAHEAANRMRSAEEIAAAKAQQAAINAGKIQEAIQSGEMTPQPPKVSETVAADLNGTSQRMSTAYKSAEELAAEAEALALKQAKAAEKEAKAATKEQVSQAAKEQKAAQAAAKAEAAATAKAQKEAIAAQKAQEAAAKQAEALAEKEADAALKTRTALEKEAAKAEAAVVAKPGRKPGDLISGFFSQLDDEAKAALAAKAPPTAEAAIPVAAPETAALLTTPAVEAPAPVAKPKGKVAKAQAQPVPAPAPVAPLEVAPAEAAAAPQASPLPATLPKDPAAALAEAFQAREATATAQPTINPRTAAIQEVLGTLPEGHPASSLIQAELQAGEAYAKAKAAAAGAPKGSPESAASRRAGVEARLAREATDAAIAQAGMEPITIPKVAKPEAPIPVLEGEVLPAPEDAVSSPVKVNGLRVKPGKVVGESPSAPPPATPELPVREAQIIATNEAPNVGKLVKKLVQDESGNVKPEVAVKMATTAAGALLGYMTNPLDDSFDSALAGGALGFAAGLGITRTNTPGLAQATSGREARASIAVKLDEMSKSFVHRLPDYQRFSYLSNIQGLVINGMIGPYGSAAMGAVEHIAQRDPRGWVVLKALGNPLKFVKYMKEVVPEAEQVLLKAEGHMGDDALSKLLVKPGEFLTMGDLAAERILVEAGFTGEEAARMLLKNEPLTATGLNIAHFPALETEGGKSSILLKLALPFKRTLANYFEQGLERTPGIGILAQRAKDIPDSYAAQFAQQSIGGVVGSIGFVLGTFFPIENARDVGKEQAIQSRETANLIRKTLSNFAGPYGMPATLGFALGQASVSQKDLLRTGIDTVSRSAPMPSLDWMGNIYDAAVDTVSGESEDSIESLRKVGIVPGFFSKGMRELMGAGVGALAPTPPQDPAAFPFIQPPSLTFTPPDIPTP